MSGIEPRSPEPRPEWVTEMIRAINETDKVLNDTIKPRWEAVTRSASIRKLEDVAQQLLEAVHDLTHADDHLVSVRRALRMAWPEGDEEEAGR